MVDHLTDLAALEWARFEGTRLAPERPEEVLEHLRECAACRAKVDGFGRLERSMHPYGTPLPPDPRIRLARRLRRVTAAVLILAAVLWAIRILGR